MARARRHQRLLSGLAFGLIALAAELLGRSLTLRADIGRHVATPSYAQADYYPILLGVVKGAIALLLARLLWRVVRARSAERSALRLVGGRARVPRMRNAWDRKEAETRDKVIASGVAVTEVDREPFALAARPVVDALLAADDEQRALHGLVMDLA